MEKGDKAEAQKVLDSIDLDQGRGPGAVRQPRDYQDQRPEGRRGDRPAGEAHRAVPEGDEPLLLPRPRLSRRPRSCRKPRRISRSSWRRRMPDARELAGCEEDPRAAQGRQVRGGAAGPVAGGDDRLRRRGNGGSSPPPSQPPPGNPQQNLCSMPATRSGVERSGERARARSPRAGEAAGAIDGSTRWRVLEDLWIHRQAAARRGPIDARPPRRPVDNVDVGAIAVLQDEGDLLVAPNPLDLRSTGLALHARMPPAATTSERSTASFRSPLGTRLTLVRRRHEASGRAVRVSSSTASRQTAAFVNSDGNVTFGEGDSRQHRAQRRAPADRTAARSPVPRGSRSQRRRYGVRERGGRPVHRDVVRRARVRLPARDDRCRPRCCPTGPSR